MTGVGPTTPPELLGSGRGALLGRLRPGGLTIAAASSIAVFGAIGFLIVTSPGWPRIQRTFFSGEHFIESSPVIVGALWKNIQLFVVAESTILVLALALAVMRSLPGPAFFPVRLMAVVYIDLFRAVPSVLVIFLLGYGMPGLRLPGVPTDPFIWGLIALVLV